MVSYITTFQIILLVWLSESLILIHALHHILLVANHQGLFFHRSDDFFEIKILVSEVVHLFLQLIHNLSVLHLHLSKIASLTFINTRHRLIISRLKNLQLRPNCLDFALFLRKPRLNVRYFVSLVLDILALHRYLRS